MMYISSPQNPRIKDILELSEKARERRQQGLFVAEGLREVGLAISAGYKVRALAWCPETTINEIDELLQLAPQEDVELLEVSMKVFEKIAYRANVPNVVAVCEAEPNQLEGLFLPENPLVLVVETVEKPGNLGAMLRTADAAGVDAVIACDPQTDWYNPNVIRASLGAIFALPIVTCTSEEAVAWLQEKNIALYVSHLEASQPYYDCDFKKPTAIVMGSEAQGISDIWIQNAHSRVIIPMHGKVDSMNVSNAAAILLFEAKRQRI